MTRDASSSTQSVYSFRAKLWRWPLGKATWHFMTLPAKIARQIRLVDAGPRRTGFGALRVQVTIGATAWQTSIFPSAPLKSYLLPVKSQVRKREELVEGKPVSVKLIVRRAG
jgi:Domain of unknown function (DUF1905)